MPESIAIVTMVYNEAVNLPIWIRHYVRHCPGASLFVIDHGSDDGSTNGLSNVSVIPLPRTPFDDAIRADLIQDLQRALLRFYDVVIYIDCDEILIADPRTHASLRSFLEANTDDVIAPVGLNLLHIRSVEPPIDLTRPILGQRRFARFASHACKPTIARVPLRWTGGFHWCDHIPTYCSDLFVFHLSNMDMGVSLQRLQITRVMSWSEHFSLPPNSRKPVRRQRQSDEARVHDSFDVPEREFFEQGAAAPFVFAAEIRRLRDTLEHRGEFYDCEFFAGPIVETPPAFFGFI